MHGISLAISLGNPAFGGNRATVLRRESDGTVTVVLLAPVWTAHLTREGDGTVTVS